MDDAQAEIFEHTDDDLDKIYSEYNNSYNNKILVKN